MRITNGEIGDRNYYQVETSVAKLEDPTIQTPVLVLQTFWSANEGQADIFTIDEASKLAIDILECIRVYHSRKEKFQ